MDERNLINGSLVSYLSWAADFISPIRWFLLAAFALVLADLKFGIEAARHRGETIRKAGQYAEAQTKSSTIFAGYWSPRALAKRSAHRSGFPYYRLSCC